MKAAWKGDAGKPDHESCFVWGCGVPVCSTREAQKLQAEVLIFKWIERSSSTPERRKWSTRGRWWAETD